MNTAKGVIADLEASGVQIELRPRKGHNPVVHFKGIEKAPEILRKTAIEMAHEILTYLTDVTTR